MIIGTILYIFGTFINALLSLLPSSPVAGGGLPTEVITAIASVYSWINAFSFLFPVDTLFEVLTLAIGFYVSIFFFKLINWIINKVRGSGS